MSTMIDKGFLFAATGEPYRDSAAEAARNLRAYCPGIAIDLFTDRPPSDAAVFDAVHPLEDAAPSPKVAAMRRTRFRQTVFLDADVRIVADCSDIFDLLDRFDLAFAQDPMRNSNAALRIWRQPLPNAFPQVNSGVMGFRRSPEVMAFLEKWAAAIADHGIGKDQPALRELLWESPLRFAILPPEYNFYDLKLLDGMNEHNAAPRIIHRRALTQYPPSPAQLPHLLGRYRHARLQMLLGADRTLPDGRATPPSAAERARLQWAELIHAASGLMPPRLRGRLRHGRRPTGSATRPAREG